MSDSDFSFFEALRIKLYRAQDQISRGSAYSYIRKYLYLYQPSARHLYAEFAPFIMGAATPYSSDEKVTMAFIAFLEEMIADIGLPNRLRDVGIPESSLDGLAKDALNQERLLMNNPRKMSFDDALSIYQAVY